MDLIKKDEDIRDLKRKIEEYVFRVCKNAQGDPRENATENRACQLG